MRTWIEHIRRFDWFLLGAILMIAILGLILLSNMAHYQSKIEPIFKKQVVVVVLGIMAIFLGSFFDYRIFKNWSWAVLLFYIASVLFLIAVLLWGSVARGSRSWFSVWSFGFQPVEMAKLALIIVLAKYFSTSHIEIHRWQHIFVSGFYFLIMFGLVLLQPDLGSAVTLFLVWLGVMLIAGIGWKKLCILGLIGICIAAFAWVSFLKPYQKNRIITFLNPSLDPLGVSYNRQQAMIAIGSGGWFGKGLSDATQSQYGFLPEVYNDFIISAFAEAWGFLGIVGLCTLWLIIMFRINKIAVHAENNFARLFTAGFLILALSHFLINAGVNFGLLPITGISSPFLSAGGSQFLIFALGVALIENIKVTGSI